MPNYTKMSAKALEHARARALSDGRVGEVAEIDLVFSERKRLRKDAPLRFPYDIGASIDEYTLTDNDPDYDYAVGSITADISNSNTPVVLVVTMANDKTITLRFDAANAAALAAVLAAGACGIALPTHPSET